MPTISVSVKNKIAIQTDRTRYVCGNSDFIAVFEFDDEWQEFETKTARFRYNGKHTEVIFTGNECEVPVITDTNDFEIGVFAGDLHTSTPAMVLCEKSILCGDGAPADPPEDVYNQLMERLNNLGGANPATTKSLGLIKVGANLKITKDGTLPVDTADAVEQDNTRPVTSAAVHTEIGNIEVLLAAL